MAHPNEALITRFYESFQKKDAQGMVDCYHPYVTFNDSVFVDLRGVRAAMMWRMLVGRSKDLTLTFNDVHADDDTGRAHWEAFYTFGSTGRKVHNIIEARFKFQDKRIIDHRDSFNFWRWSSQALGPTGIFLGWTPFLQKKVQATSADTLNRYIASQTTAS